MFLKIFFFAFHFLNPINLLFADLTFVNMLNMLNCPYVKAMHVLFNHPVDI